MKQNPWVVVLAGGEGARMRPVVERWLGRHRPKQYCAFSGTRTMLEHTLERALSLTRPERILTVIGPGHRAYLAGLPTLPGRIVEQPANRETAPGLYLPLLQILREDPQAVVVVLPSDHFVCPRERFAAEASEAVAAAERQKDKIILLACPPSRPETDYGWLEPGNPVAGERAWSVARFHEKPQPATARRLLELGYLWNTMILAAKAPALWHMGARLRPDMTRLLRELALQPRGIFERRALREIYRRMPSINFSRDLLEREPAAALLLPLSGVRWCDWGRPERITETLAALGKPSPFEALAAPAVMA
ncbi:MAG: NTP transferase domain-containing protein [Elusimicrobia bacterium]|nr:NTP transferase domain-containing protein [Elusimicrobiota bacterium]MDE2236756.1 NTP transferase domain-containing protein [Elusimicrobiota bacterium]MDE2425580.1 NTP transferase domain-containing protein [Elusimicrobiota bacterium]